MSEILASYSFLPWLRKGLANNIIQGDNDPSVILRASIPVSLTIAATKIDGSPEADQIVEKTIEMYGPGDIVGIDSRVIVKTEPRNWITNFEPNYLPYIEFYEEDFPWRYTPSRQNGDRLKSWLTLVVLKEDEFEEGQNITNKPLPFFKLKSGAKPSIIFPDPHYSWAWSHVHVNTDLSNGALPNTADGNTIKSAITNLLNQNPDRAYSRIICPRKLESNIGYYAFLIPTFESGRLTGLGYDLPSDLVATESAWKNDSIVEFPYYYRWYFKTGDIGDFEFLVNLLQPKLADKSIGVRDMGVLNPGSNLPPIDNEGLNGVLKLGGALRVPFDSLKPEDKLEVEMYDQWDEHPYPHAFSSAMARRINLADDYTDPSNVITDVNREANIVIGENVGDPDPVITSPLYGRWHALQQRLLIDKSGNNLPYNKNWIHELNLDPRFRVAAGLGTKVVQKGQEEYMQAAWEQVGKIVEANNQIRLAQLAQEVSHRLYVDHLLTQHMEQAFTFTSPVHSRILGSKITVKKKVQDSYIPSALTSGVFRKIIRPRGKLIKQLKFDENKNTNNLLTRVNEREIIPVPPKTDPPGSINLSDIEAAFKPKSIPGFVENLLRKFKWFKFIPILLLIFAALLLLPLIGVGIVSLSVLSAVAAFSVVSFNKLKNWENELIQANAISQNSQISSAVNDYPLSPNFRISNPSSSFAPVNGSVDSVESQNFKSALRDTFQIVDIKFPEPERNRLDLNNITDKLLRAVDPTYTIPQRTFNSIEIPLRIVDDIVETFTPVMVYPEVDIPMYKPLAEMSSELFLPNINLIEQNSITLLENNQKFIESYMVGINHEFSRELIWREFPTDLRGSYFRQFWDVNSFLPPQPIPDNFRDSLKDIPPIHTWNKTPSIAKPKRNELGEHNQRALSSGKTQLVLVIRGELLKKYPTAVIYAHKADWGKKNNVKDVREERVLIELNESENINPPLSKIKTPLFEAKIEPDIYFLGFDLDDEEARGTINPTSINNNPGWFFIIKERPGEPRFGLDIEKARNAEGNFKIINWNNLSWKDIGTLDGACIELNRTITFNSYSSNADQDNVINPDDDQSRWSPDTNAAELAYILYQVPVLVAVHASRMLPKLNNQ